MELAAKNNGEVDAASREGLLDTVRALERAVALGYEQPSHAYLQIGRAYQSIALSFREGLSERQVADYVSAAKSAFRKAVDAKPAEAEPCIELVPYIEGSELHSVVVEAVRREPANPMAQHLLGIVLVREGRGREAVPHLERAMKSFGDSERQTYGAQAVEELRKRGLTREADALERESSSP